MTPNDRFGPDRFTHQILYDSFYNFRDCNKFIDFGRVIKNSYHPSWNWLFIIIPFVPEVWPPFLKGLQLNRWIKNMYVYFD